MQLVPLNVSLPTMLHAISLLELLPHAEQAPGGFADSNCTAIFHQYLYGPAITATWTHGD